MCTRSYFGHRIFVEPNADLDNLNHSEDDLEADNESDIQLDNTVNNTKTIKQRNDSAAPNDPGMIRPTRRSKKTDE